MVVHMTLDDCISALVLDINENLRKRLQEALCTLRDATSVSGAIMNVQRLFEGQRGFLVVIATAAGHTLSHRSIKKGYNALTIELAANGVIPSSIFDDLDWIRNQRNPTTHNEVDLRIEDAEMVLERALHVVEWFYCHYVHGPRLASIYAAEYQPITLLGHIARIDPSSAPLWKLIMSTLTLDEEGESSPREGSAPDQLRIDPHRSLRTLERSLSHFSNPELVLKSAFQFSIFHDFQGHRDQARKVLRDALSLIFVQGRDAPVEWQIRVLDRAAHLAIKQADCAQAEEFANKMLELSQGVEQNLSVATALQRLGRLHYFRCDSDQARKFLEESLTQFQSLEPKDFKGIAWVQFDLGMLEFDLGNLTAAREWLEKSLDLHEKYGDRNEEGTVRVNLAFVHHRLGDREIAHAHMNKAADLLRRENYFRWYRHFLGRIEVDESLFEPARIHFSESLEMFRDRGDTLGIIRSLLGFSLLAAKEVDWEKALMLLRAEDVQRSEQMERLPFPPDWEEEKKFIETGAHQALGTAAFNAVLKKGGALTLEQAINICLT